jgi:CRISPR-associated protein Csb3
LAYLESLLRAADALASDPGRVDRLENLPSEDLEKPRKTVQGQRRLSPERTPAIRLTVDPRNPGQFFACCGLLEMADRLWGGAEGWFQDRAATFCLAPMSETAEADAEQLIRALAECKLTNTMSEQQVRRRKELGDKKKKEMSQSEEEEKKQLDKLWREKPLVFHAPFNLRVDWFTDERAGGDRYKTWAGQQSVIEIARAMKKPIEDGGWTGVPPTDWLSRTGGEGVPFNFDSNLGAQSSSIDVGFSLDPLEMGTRTRPLIELAAFIGLQRFRPYSEPSVNLHTYTAWTIPLLPEVAAVAAAGRLEVAEWPRFEFRLLYRTKYLKSFLPAIPSRGDA